MFVIRKSIDANNLDTNGKVGSARILRKRLRLLLNTLGISHRATRQVSLSESDSEHGASIYFAKTRDLFHEESGVVPPRPGRGAEGSRTPGLLDATEAL